MFMLSSLHLPFLLGFLSAKAGESHEVGKSYTHTRDWGKRKHSRDGTTYSRSRSTGDARGIEASGQTMGGSAQGVSALWRKAAQTGGNSAPGNRHDLRARGGSATAVPRP